MSWLDTYIYKKFNKYPCALPESIRNYKGTGMVRRHDDWPPILNKIPRSWNAKGPRCKQSLCKDCNGEGYAQWPPKLVEGKSITRWENAGATSILYIPTLDKKVINDSFYGTQIRAWETNPGHPDFRTEVWKLITWKEGDLGPDMYSPSALQRWSDQGYLKMSPRYYSWWKVLKENEDPFKSTRVTGENKVAFLRTKWRPDHLDIYYNRGPMAGLQMD